MKFFTGLFMILTLTASLAKAQNPEAECGSLAIKEIVKIYETHTKVQLTELSDRCLAEADEIETLAIQATDVRERNRLYVLSAEARGNGKAFAIFGVR